MTDRIEAAEERIRVLDFRLSRPHSEFVDKEAAKALLEDAKFLSAELQRVRGERDEARKNVGPAAYGYKDGTYNICLGYHEEQDEYEWLEVVAASRLASLSADHQRVVNAVREWQEARKAMDDSFGAGPGELYILQSRENQTTAALSTLALPEDKE